MRGEEDSYKKTMIVVHHTASDTSMEKAIAGETRHRGAVPYHYLIGKDGEIVHTRGDDEVPGSTLSGEVNRHAIQIALIGNFQIAPPTELQKKSLRSLISKYGLPVRLHRDVGKTACPGKYFTY